MRQYCARCGNSSEKDLIQYALNGNKDAFSARLFNSTETNLHLPQQISLDVEQAIDVKRTKCFKRALGGIRLAVLSGMVAVA
jgi:hypothetical protein